MKNETNEVHNTEHSGICAKKRLKYTKMNVNKVRTNLEEPK